ATVTLPKPYRDVRVEIGHFVFLRDGRLLRVAAIRSSLSRFASSVHAHWTSRFFESTTLNGGSLAIRSQMLSFFSGTIFRIFPFRSTSIGFPVSRTSSRIE